MTTCSLLLHPKRQKQKIPEVRAAILSLASCKDFERLIRGANTQTHSPHTAAGFCERRLRRPPRVV
jgi:hypothetical protein